MQRDNFYILLDLDITVKDRNTIEQAIRSKQMLWSKQRQHPSLGTMYSSYLSQIANIRRVMSDEKSREQEAQQAKDIRLREQKEQNKELDKAIKTMCIKGHVYEGEIEKYLKRTQNKRLNLNDVKARIPKNIEIRKGDHKDTQNKKVKPLDSSIAKNIESKLNIINRKDLYHFLAVVPTSSSAVLIKKIEEKEKWIQSQAIKDAEFSAIQELAGYVRNYLMNRDKRAAYDATLNLNRFKTLGKLLLIAGNDEIIETSEYDHLLSEGGKIGLSKKEIEVYIQEQCRKKGWLLMRSDHAQSANQQCGVCGIINHQKAKKCSGCATDLSVKCPKCQTTNPSTEKVCTNCGFAVGDMPNALPLLRDAKNALSTGLVSEAEKLLTEAEIYWKNHPDASEIRKKIIAVKSQSESHYLELQKIVQQKKLCAAEKYLDDYSQLINSGIKFTRLKSEIISGIQKASKLTTAGIEQTNLEKKELLFLQALNICADYTKASIGLEQILPSSPTQLRVQSSNRTVDLSWEEVKSSRPINYFILRKQDTPPKNHLDGERLTDTTQTVFRDISGVSGYSYRYAVFTQRQSAVSEKAAVSPLVTITADVENLHCTSGEEQLRLDWKLPPNAWKVEIRYAKNTAPLDNQSGQRLNTVRPDGILVSNLINKQNYGFSVKTVFKTKSGQLHYSKGIQIIGTPNSPPKAVGILEVKQNGNMAHLSWLPNADTVELYQSKTPFPYQLHEQIEYTQILSKGKRINLRDKTNADFRLTEHGITHIMAVTLKGNTIIAGACKILTHLLPVTGLKAKIKEEEIRLVWDFPKGAKKVIISVAENEITGLADYFETTKIEYFKKGYFSIPLDKSNKSEAFITVKTVLDNKEGKEFSTPLSIKLKIVKPIIEFVVKEEKSFMSVFSKKQIRFNIQLKYNSPPETNLTLFVKEGNKIINFNDAQKKALHTWTTEASPNGTQYLPLSYKPINKNCKYLFFSILPNKKEDFEQITIIGNGQKIAF